MAAPSRIATTSVASSNSAISIDFTGLVASGDLLLIHRMTNAQEAGGNVPPSGGWAQVSASPQTIGTSGGVGATAVNLYWKLSDGAETTVDLGDAGAFNRAIGIVYRGVHQTTPIHAAAGNTQDDSSTTATMPDVTTTVDECMVVHAVALGRDATGGSWASWTNSNLTSLTEFHDEGTSTGNGGVMALADGVMATAGAVGGTTATKSAFNSAHITIAIAPASAVPEVDPADASHAHSSGSPAITFVPRATPANALHAHLGGGVTVSYSGPVSVTPASATHGHAAQVVTLTVEPPGALDGGSVVVPDFGRRVTFYGGDEVLIFPQPFDPADIQKYTFDFAPSLGATESIATTTLALATGSPSGVVIGVGAYAPISGGTTIDFHLQGTSDVAMPVDLGVVATITTNAVPPRKMQRTGIVKVRQL